MLRFRRMRSLQKFASVRASVTNHFKSEASPADGGARECREGAQATGYPDDVTRPQPDAAGP
jgi:hypothetical protein